MAKHRKGSLRAPETRLSTSNVIGAKGSSGEEIDRKTFYAVPNRAMLRAEARRRKP